MSPTASNSSGNRSVRRPKKTGKKESGKEEPGKTDVTVKGRVVGVRLSRPDCVEYIFQPEVIENIQVDGGFLQAINGKRKGDRYPLLRFDSPFVVDSGVSDAFSSGYLLMERKESVYLDIDGFGESDGDKDSGALKVKVKSIFIGFGFECLKSTDKK